MADVFLSYARADREAAERLANAIAETGLTVWWDRHIKGGAEFSRDIEQQLDAAAKVLVLWSKDSVVSRWVRDEASVAADSERLVGATIDGTPPPLGFRQFQTIDLKAWAAKGAAIPPALAEALEAEPPTTAAKPAERTPRRRWIAVAGAAVLVAGAATVAIVQPAPFDRLLSGETRDEALSLAIMPFDSQGAGMDYVGTGLASALTDSLGSLSGLKITASTSTHAIAGQGLTAPEIAEKLGVSHLVEGNVQRAGERYSISMRLIEARTSEQVWARNFEGGPNELQLLKNRMARELAGGLRARLGVGQGEIAERRDVDPRAYEAYLRALERVSVRDAEEARLEAIKQFRLAASLEPDFADAHAGYAYLMALSVPDQLGMDWRELIAEQHRATARALQLDPGNNLALVAKATALQNFEGQVEQPTELMEAVLERSPNLGAAHYSLASALWMSGRAREALDHLDQAIDRDPFDSLLRFYRGKILYSLGDYEAVRTATMECPEPCGGMGYYWFLAMAGFATPAEYRDDFSALAERAVSSGIRPDEVTDARKIVEALIFGGQYKPAPLDDENLQFTEAAIIARLISFDDGLRAARVPLERSQPDSIIDILNDGRVTFTAEQRADPRYHQLFRHPKLAEIAAARRKLGVTAGLPVFPERPYAGR